MIPSAIAAAEFVTSCGCPSARTRRHLLRRLTAPIFIPSAATRKLIPARWNAARYFASIALILLSACAAPLPAQEKPKPEIKGTSALTLHAGQKVTLLLYGENLNPKEVSAGKPIIAVRLLETKATEGDAKPRGSKQVSIEISAAADAPQEVVVLTLTNTDGEKAEARIAIVDDTPEVEVKRPNERFEEAMPLSGPRIAVIGAMQSGKPDLFRFEAKAGEVWEARLLAGRAGSQLDALLRLRDARRNTLALSGGHPKRDRKIRFTAPASGTYYLELTDSGERGGPNFAYRLTLRRTDK